MRITDLLSKESIRLDGVSSTKKKPFVQWQTYGKERKISDKNAYVEGLIKKREKKVRRQSARVSQFLIIKAVGDKTRTCGNGNQKTVLILIR